MGWTEGVDEGWLRIRNRRGEVESGYQCTLNVDTSEPGIRDWVLFDHWIRDPGSGIGFFRIPDPKTIFLRAF